MLRPLFFLGWILVGLELVHVALRLESLIEVPLALLVLIEVPLVLVVLIEVPLVLVAGLTRFGYVSRFSTLPC